MSVVEVTRTGWGFAPGETVVTGLRAWALLGGGRRCETWLAWSTAWWMPVVLKLPRPALVADPQTRGDLANEAEVTAGLAHPGVQRRYAAVLDADLPYLLSEYVEGPTLDTSLAQDGPLAPAEVALLGMQLAGALRYLHGRGIVHLDLKPSNVCLRDGRPVVIDFGIARAAGTRRRAGAPRGSAPFMSAEQCRDDPATPAADLFALGALLFEAATGDHAFHPRRLGTEWLYPQLAGTGPEPLPGALGEVIGRLLEPEPARRPADATAVLWALAATLPPGAELWPAWLDPDDSG
jgi:serine/threonine protein kinase